MIRNAYSGPKLPRTLLDQVQDSNDSRFRSSGAVRKAQRKAARQEKKASHVQDRGRRGFVYGRDRVEVTNWGDSVDGEIETQVRPKRSRKGPQKEAKPLKSILKTQKPKGDEISADESDEESREEDEDENEAEDEDGDEHVAPIVPAAVKTRLAEDDAEISALEKKLGIKGKKSKALEQDGLDWLAEGSDSDDGDTNRKRKRPEDTRWLQDKRVKATQPDYQDAWGQTQRSEKDLMSEDEDPAGHDDEIENPFSEDEVDSDDFDGFDSQDSSEQELTAPAPRRRENPYVAPVTSDTALAAKYVPPSMRKPPASDEEALRQLRRQTQGQLNRLSEANLVSILQAVEELYTRNARQYVTSVMVDLLISLVSDPAVLNDTFLILHAGFAEALYKTMGTDFGAQLLEKLVENIDHFRSRSSNTGKQVLNLLAFTSCLYNFRLVGSPILFDYIRSLLDELSETNTELLLRIIRTSGQELRQDDPSALKDIVLLVQRSVAQQGEAQLSVRTKFMIETIQDLKNNRMKTGAARSTLAAEHTAGMRKTLSSLNNTRTLKATEPLRVSLADIRDSEKKGKWWLVGASYHDPAKVTSNSTPSGRTKASLDDVDAGYESETPGSVNLHRLARSQGMNTDVRRAIFVAILSSADYKEAHLRVLKLHLKNKQMLEVPRVLVHCTGAEQAYNPYYALVAAKFCNEHRLRKAFHFALWDVLRRIEQAGDEDEDDQQSLTMRQVVNVAKFYGMLIAQGGLTMGALRKLSPDYAYWAADMTMFVEVLMTTVLLELGKKGSSAYDEAVNTVFLTAAGAPEVIPALKYALEASVTKAELAKSKKEKRLVGQGCAMAIEALEEAARTAPAADDSEEDSE